MAECESLGTGPGLLHFLGTYCVAEPFASLGVGGCPASSFALSAATSRATTLPTNAELVLLQHLVAHYTTVPVHELPPGCYSAELLAHGQRTARHTVVVQR